MPSGEDRSRLYQQFDGFHNSEFYPEAADVATLQDHLFFYSDMPGAEGLRRKMIEAGVKPPRERQRIS